MKSPKLARLSLMFFSSPLLVRQNGQAPLPPKPSPGTTRHLAEAEQAWHKKSPKQTPKMPPHSPAWAWSSPGKENTSKLFRLQRQLPESSAPRPPI